MAEFTQRTLNTIEAFASSMNLPTIPAPDGSFSFRFQRSGELNITPSTDNRRLLVNLSRMPASPDTEHQYHFLRRAGRDLTRNRFLHTGLAPDGSFVFVISIDEDRFSLQELEQTVDDLIAAHDSLSL